MDDMINKMMSCLLATPLHAEFWIEREMICQLKGEPEFPQCFLAHDTLNHLYNIFLYIGQATLTIYQTKNLEDCIKKMPFREKIFSGQLEIACPKDDVYELINKHFKTINIEQLQS